MTRRHKNAWYTTESAQDVREGWSALELHRTAGEVAQVVARVVYWDADGQFALEMTVPELPLEIVEDLVGEARGSIKVR